MLLLYFDHVSPAAAVACLRLQALADEGVGVTFVGLDTLGLEVAIPATLDQLEQVERWRDDAGELGLELRRPAWRPPTLPAHLVGELAERVGLGAAWRRTCLLAYWHDGADLGTPEVLRELASRAGLDRREVAAALADRDARLALRRRMLTMRSRGVGGVPVLEVEGTFVSPDLPVEDLRRLGTLTA